MSDEYIDPVDSVPPSPPVVSGRVEGPAGPRSHGSISGLVVAVRRKTSRHAEEHLLDTSVGGQEHSEVVVQVNRNDLEELVGKQVVIHFRED